MTARLEFAYRNATGWAEDDGETYSWHYGKTKEEQTGTAHAPIVECLESGETIAQLSVERVEDEENDRVYAFESYDTPTPAHRIERLAELLRHHGASITSLTTS